MRGVCKSEKNKLKEGRGIYRGDDYVPWIKVREISSRGRSHRIYGLKHKRVYHFLSDLEYYFALLLYWNEKVIEIREQYPLLPILLTKHISFEKGIKHNSFRGKDVVMTCDFLITVNKNGYKEDIARTVKYSKDLEDPRVLQKFDIERTYFIHKYNKVDFDWGIVTEKNINVIKAKNIDSFFQDQFWAQKNGISKELIHQMTYNFKNMMDPNNFKASVVEYASQFNLEEANAISFIRYLISTKQLKVDLSSKMIKSLEDIKIKE